MTSECVGNVVHSRDDPAVVTMYEEHVEPIAANAALERRVARHPRDGGTTNAVALATVDRLFHADAPRACGLHFRKDHGVTAPRDEVDLTHAGLHPVTEQLPAGIDEAIGDDLLAKQA